MPGLTASCTPVVRWMAMAVSVNARVMKFINEIDGPMAIKMNTK